MHLKSVFAILIAITFMACQNESRQEGNSNDSKDSGQTKNKNEVAFKSEGRLDITKQDGELVRALDIEIADNEYERERGLMHRRFLPENSGMLFIFNRDEYRSFWMKNTVISLDILFIGKDKVINTIQKYTVPFSEASVPSASPSTYVLEVNAGYCDTHGIKEGMKISWKKLSEN